jgi:hypothetical protein
VASFSSEAFITCLKMLFIVAENGYGLMKIVAGVCCNVYIYQLLAFLSFRRSPECSGIQGAKLNPVFRRGDADGVRVVVSFIVIPAQAGIQGEQGG